MDENNFILPLTDPIQSLEEIEYMNSDDFMYDDIYNFSKMDYIGVREKFCQLGRPADEAADVLTTFVSVVGVVMNIIVLFVVAALKEYKQSCVHWSAMMIFFSNAIFLTWVLLHMINEFYGHWIMGITMCKLDEATIFTTKAGSALFLVIANILSIISLTDFENWLKFNLPKKLKKMNNIWSYSIAIVIVFVSSSLMNLPIYQFKTLNTCQRCVLRLPVHLYDLCPMFGLSDAACQDFTNFMENEIERSYNFTDTLDGDMDFLEVSGYDLNPNVSSGDLENGTIEIVGDPVCGYDEPRLFYAWLISSFSIFYLLPVVASVIFGMFWYWNMARSNSESKNSKAPLFKYVLVMDVFFVVCWTPWYAVHMRKAYGGLAGTEQQCASLIHYSRVFAVLFNSLSPAIYAYMTGKFKFRFSQSIAKSTHFCYDMLSYHDKEAEPATNKMSEIAENTFTSDQSEDTQNDDQLTDKAGIIA